MLLEPVLTGSLRRVDVRLPRPGVRKWSVNSVRSPGICVGSATKSLAHCRTCPLFPRVTLTRRIESHNPSEHFAQLYFVWNKYAIHVTRSLELVYI